MNNIYHGDLTDIIRAGGGDPPPETSADTPSWQFHSNSSNYATCPADDFGDPFAYLRDPLLHRAPPEFFHSSGMIKSATNGGGFFGNNNLGHRILDDGMERPPNILSRMPQISPAIKISISPAAVGVSPTGLVLSEDLTSISPSSMQISSPQNAGIRRRKNQTKKVLCIPAPIPAGSSRPTAGEIVPSDLWAWRKYGQKPIKGSPYPRGYYRCSSSKGCLARKQVERSRTDPNMLVITYTSDHNHPWPTKRNALAGSTRTHPSKTSSKSKNQKEEHTEINTKHVAPSLPNSAAVKAEAEMHDGGEFDDSFFANLGEIEGDSLDFLFAKGFDGHDGKDLDSFTFCDWDDDHRITKSSRATLSDKNL